MGRPLGIVLLNEVQVFPPDGGTLCSLGIGGVNLLVSGCPLCKGLIWVFLQTTHVHRGQHVHREQVVVMHALVLSRQAMYKAFIV